MIDLSEYDEGASEVLDILKYVDEETLELIPLEFIRKLNEVKSKTYKPKIDYTKSLEENNLKQSTKNLLTLIYIDYLCNDEEKKDIYKLINPEYNDTPFQKNEDIQNSTEVKQEDKALVEISKNTSIFSKILNKIFGKKF